MSHMFCNLSTSGCHVMTFNNYVQFTKKTMHNGFRPDYELHICPLVVPKMIVLRHSPRKWEFPWSRVIAWSMPCVFAMEITELDPYSKRGTKFH